MTPEPVSTTARTATLSRLKNCDFMMKITDFLKIDGIMVLSVIMFLFVAPSTQAQFGYTTNADDTITITEYEGPGGSVAIPSMLDSLPVTAIASGAFGVDGISNVTIPSSVTTVDNLAFYECSNLAEVTISNGVATIGTFAFGRTALTEILIPPSVTNISGGAFSGCLSLIGITVNPQNANYADVDGVVFDKSQTTLVQYPGGLNEGYAIPESVTSIGDYAFDSTALDGITIPSNVTNIGYAAFWNTLLTNVTIPCNVGEFAFGLCPELTNAMLTSGVTIIASGMFEACPSLYTFAFPDSVTNIGDSAFFGCTNLTSVTIPRTVTRIENSAFSSCYKLANVTLTNGLVNIGSWAFEACFALTNITIPEGVVSIGDSAFSACSLSSITIPVTVTNMGNETFWGDSSLTNVTFCNYLTTIGHDAFFDCGLVSVMIPASVSNIEDNAFYGCGALTSIYFKGNAPSADSTVFTGDNVLAYYLPGTTGWAEFSANTGVMAVLWNPLIQISDGNFGIRGSQFGFDITGTPNIPIVIEACTNLANPVWTPLEAFTLTNGLFYFSEPLQPNTAGRFYRVSSP